MTNVDADKIPTNLSAADEIADADLKAFCDEIVLCLRVYGKLAEQAARQRLDESGICSPERIETNLSRSLLFHEEPYYWAMDLLYGQEHSRWWDEPSLGKLWPPPAEYHDPSWPDNV